MPRPQKLCENIEPCPTPPEQEEEPTSPPCIFLPTPEEPSTPTTEEPTTQTEPVIYLTQAPPNLTSSVHYFVGPWSRCNGTGYRRRIVHCQTFLEIVNTVAGLPDTECLDSKPVDMEPCAASCPPPFPPRAKEPEKEKIVKEDTVNEDKEKIKEETVKENNVEENTIEEDKVGKDILEELEEKVITATEKYEFYSWNTEKFSPCSASCSGGKHTSIIRCLRLPGEVEVSPQLCDAAVKPDALTKKCNEQACPLSYKWHIGEFGNCSKECGGGIKTRLVKCLSITTETEVAAVRCPGQPKKSVEPCNVFDCEPAWKAEQWSKCSRSCSGGFQTRKLHCETILAPLSQAIQLPPSKCLKTRPKAVKKCNLKPCPPPPKTTTTTTTTTQKPTTITVDDESQLQTSRPEEPIFIQKQPNRRVTLKASGQALLFKGSNAKFHCPVEPNSNSSSNGVLWFKGHLRIPPSAANGWPRVSVSSKGALRVHKITFADAGIYTCLSGAFRSDVVVRVKPLPVKYSETGFFADTSSISFSSTTFSPDIENRHRKLTNRSTLPQVRHFLVNMRHFGAERVKSDKAVLEYKWVLGDWSKCSHSCGEAGIQTRTTECRVALPDVDTRHITKGLCVDAGLPEPQTVRYCQLKPCPEWRTGEWSECSSKNCLSWNTAYQKRSVFCELANKTITPSHCDNRKRPRRKHECFNVNCKGTWKVGQWSECTATCGIKGFRSRLVQCVWHGNEDPAHPSACKGPPPHSSMPCGRQPCKHGDEEDCYDQSTYCDVLKGTKLCEANQFRIQCCASCEMRN